MRQLLIFILLIFIANPISAKCGGHGISSISNSPTLNKDGLIILEFYWGSQGLIPELNKKYPIYLYSEKEKISLIPVEILKGEFEVTEVIFKPASELRKNEDYQLHIKHLPKYEEQPQRYNRHTQKYESLTFRINDRSIIETPFLNGPVTEIKKSFSLYGCGPEIWVYFKVPVSEDRELFVRATVKSKSNGKSSDYILPIENGQIKIGHTMCSGAFYFDRGHEYELSISVLDQCGNTSAPTKAISFSSPENEISDQ